MISKGSTTASLAALLALAPSLALAQMAAASGKPLVLAQVTPPPLPQPPSAQFFYSENGKPVGPVTLAELQAKIASGAIKPDTLVWKAGAPNWVAAKELTEVAALFAAATPAPAPAPAPTPAPTPVAAGCTGKVLMSDDFRQIDDSWGVEADSDAVSVEDGKVKVKSSPNGTYKLVYNGQQFDDGDYCVTVQAPNNLKDVNDTSVLAGLIFWSQDGSNFYSLQVAPNGAASLGRVAKGKWATPVPFHLFNAVIKGAGAKNMLRVTTSGSSIIAYINGQKFASIKGQLPDGGGAVGLYAQSEKSSRDTWKFIDLKVTEHAQ
jgi:hypothetical protein